MSDIPTITTKTTEKKEKYRMIIENMADPKDRIEVLCDGAVGLIGGLSQDGKRVDVNAVYAGEGGTIRTIITVAPDIILQLAQDLFFKDKVDQKKLDKNAVTN